MEKGLISIIVPVYNAEKTIKKCVNSLIHQTYKQLEIILIDDGSSDESWKILEFLNNMDNRIKCYHQNNAGVSAARNYGLKVANGEYIGFCDSDDWVDEDMFEILLHNMIDLDADISIVQLYWERETLSFMPFGNDYQIIEYSTEQALTELNRGKLFLGQLWNKLFRSAVIDDLFFDTSISICEDVLFVNHAFVKANKVVFQNICKYHYWDNPLSAMNEEYEEKYWSRRLAYLQIIDLLKNNGKKEAIPYAYRSLINGNLVIAKKMCISRQLDKYHYEQLRKDIITKRKLASNDFSIIQRLDILIFCLSRKLFVFYFKLTKRKLNK